MTCTCSNISRCQSCYQKQYREKNKEILKKKKEEYYKKNLENILQKKKEYYQDNKEEFIENAKENYNKNKEVILSQQKEYRKNNINYIRQYHNNYTRNKRKTDPLFKLRSNCSRLIHFALKGNKRKFSILNYLPYTMEELKNHLEHQFDDKMTWDNYGSYWHIDHIIPQIKLQFSSMTEENFTKCWSLSNLRPLEAIQNMKKGAR